MTYGLYHARNQNTEMKADFPRLLLHPTFIRTLLALDQLSALDFIYSEPDRHLLLWVIYYILYFSWVPFLWTMEYSYLGLIPEYEF